jgi:hypothetical protein
MHAMAAPEHRDVNSDLMNQIKIILCKKGMKLGE